MNETKSLGLCLFGGDLADYRETDKILEEIRKIDGCITAINKPLEIKKDQLGNVIEFKSACYSEIIINWAVENKEFLVALASLFYLIFQKNKDKRNKIEITNNHYWIDQRDNMGQIVNKFESSR